MTSIEGATEVHAGMVTFEFALQPTAGAPLGPTHVVQVNVSGGAVHFDLATASPVGEGVGWDLLFDGYDIRVNGGVSGNGSAGALPTEESFEAITDASGGGAPFFSDAFGGVFADHPWYRYNLQGNRFVHPTYDVYLIRKGTQVYKIQVTSYYSAAGASRHITFRYALVQ